jgi:hypothetical protein
MRTLGISAQPTETDIQVNRKNGENAARIA